VRRQDPDARALFEAALRNDASVAAAVFGPLVTDAGSGPYDGLPGYVTNVFGRSPSGQLRGWVALVRGDSTGTTHTNFDGFTLSLSSLPPVGAVLRARDTLPVWRQPSTDPTTKARSTAAWLRGAAYA
jgi:hypothetical protein